MIFFRFAFLVVGLSVGFRIFYFLQRENKFSKEELTKIGTTSLLIFIFLVLFLPKNTFSLVIAEIFSLFLLFFMPKILRWYRENHFRKNFLGFLNQIVLSMSAGNSFRRSFLIAVEDSEGFLQPIGREIYEIVTFSQQFSLFSRNSFLQEVVKELKNIDGEKENAFQKVKNLRRRVKIQNIFRHRSGQATRQIKVQSFILTILYFGLFVFVLLRFGWGENSGVLLSSASLFLLGLVWIFFSGRRMKWKV